MRAFAFVVALPALLVLFIAATAAGIFARMGLGTQAEMRT
jgi:hypothetical protein